MSCPSKKILSTESQNFTVAAFSAAFPKLAVLSERVIAEAKCENKRDCPLKPNLVLWLVIFLGLYRDLSIPGVFRQLLAFIKQRQPDLSLRAVTPEALHHARRRLGSEPLKQLFRESYSLREANVEKFKNLRTLGVDGSYFRLADTSANEAEFGRKTGRTDAAYPQLLAIFLSELSTHKIVDASFHHCLSGEREPALEMISALNSDDLLIMDRGFPSYEVYRDCQRVGCHFLARISKNWKPAVIRSLGDGDQLVLVKPRQHAKKRQVERGLPSTSSLILRMVSYSVNGGETIRVLTDLLDTKLYPARELAELYYTRWESEMVFDEYKVHLLGTRTGKQPTNFRSKKPDGVLQEAYGVLLVYNLIRDMICLAAESSDRPTRPLQISFQETVEILNIYAVRFETEDCKKRLLESLLREISACILRDRRGRRCPRKVKIKMSRFPRKRRADNELPPIPRDAVELAEVA